MTPVDSSDPTVAFLTWVLTWVAGRLVSGPKLQKLRHALPIAAVLIAIGLRAAIETSEGVELSLSTVLRGIAAGGAAVLGHSQLRELHKALAKPEVAPSLPDVEESLGDLPPPG